MTPYSFHSFVSASLGFFAILFVVVVGSLVLGVVVLFIVDVTQHKNAVRKNFPVLGRFRSLFTSLGEFFRQYFFAMDREEMPFNRAERAWIERATQKHDNTIAFGSTKNLTSLGAPIFVNCPFPTLDENAVGMKPLLIGPTCKVPYNAPSFFNISAMSYGALSAPAVRALSRGARMASCWMNTGEGGLTAYHLEGGADIVFQIGTAKYGVRNEKGHLCDHKLKEIAAHKQVRMFELKMSQGAKPGKGGILPAVKVTEEIAGIRGIPEGQDSISPNRHPEIDNQDQLLDMLDHIREVTGKPVGFKAVFGSFGWFETLCKKIHERGLSKAPDFITVDSGDGGTGAAPMPLMDNVGLLIKESLPMVANVLRQYGLQNRIRVIVSGKLVNPSGVAWALAAGADFVNSARGFMFALGCIQSLKCNKNTCPTGVTTHNKHLQKGLNPEDKAERVAQYCWNIIHEVQIISHSCGVSRPRLMRRGHVRLVQANGTTLPMDALFPYPEVVSEYAPVATRIKADVESMQAKMDGELPA